ncbi:MAG: 30S ribosomal protein S19, partial [Nanoarchaeota archaeon]|nr:30S ribosomal protein S19 [Nanoarchaeota archaeon]MBU1988891.1 30S ribosomal protein S19 [Nanoarchaeota archaeon]
MAHKKKQKEQVRRKELIYRGKTLEELKTLDVRESAKFLPSRSRRSVIRNFQTIEKFIKRCEKKVAKNKKIKTHLRDL